MELTTNKKTLILILIAFAFSFSVRLIWIQQFHEMELFKFNNEFMLTTNDGYAFAEGARDIISGESQENDLSKTDSALSKLTAFLVQILPVSLDTLVFYMPAFFSSLIVVPIILIAREFDRLEVGFIAGLVGSIAWSYYNRTMVGYYDTDLLNIVFPTVLLWSLIWSIKEQDEKYFLIAALDSVAYRWWYPQSYSLEIAFVGLIFLFVVYQFIKKQDFKMNLLLISFMLFAIINLDSWIRLSIVIVFFIALKAKKEFILKYIYYIFVVAVVLFFATGGFDPIWYKLKGYIVRDALVTNTSSGLGLQFFSVMQTVREAGAISFETFANRISGHTVTFIASIIGYIWFSFRHPVMLLALPMVGLGFLAYGIPGFINGGGLRFTVYAVPVMALGIGYLIYGISEYLSTKFINNKTANIMKCFFMGIFTTLVLYPNVQHILGYKMPTVFNQLEVKVLDLLKTKAGREDYVVSWWDYGYPIRYYTDVKTLTDGGKHSGDVNFPVSYILNKPQKQAANMARLDTEYTEKRFHKKSDEKWAGSNIEQMTIDYGYKDTNKFLATLSGDIKLPQSTRDVYLYLPLRMLDIFSTISIFSNLDLMNGQKKAKPFFYQSKVFKESKDIIDLNHNIKVLKNKGAIQLGRQVLKINNFIVTQYDNNGVLKKSVQTIDKNSPINVIYLKDFKQFLVLESRVYNSSFIQMFVLENYDKELFEPTILTPVAKVYKLKI